MVDYNLVDLVNEDHAVLFYSLYGLLLNLQQHYHHHNMSRPAASCASATR